MRRILQCVKRVQFELVNCLHYSQNSNNDKLQQHRASAQHRKLYQQEKNSKQKRQQQIVKKRIRFNMSWMKQLPDPPYALPKSPLFALQRSGCYNKQWLMQQWDNTRHPTHAIKQAKILDKQTFWSLPPHEALDLIARIQPYHDTLQLIMQHSWFWLFQVVMHAEDVPLPHIVYADFMKCCTFSSLQVPPQYQFALTPSLLRSLLCLSAYYCTIDKYYFTSTHMMYQMMQQQQHSSSEFLSSWVYVCTAANKLQIALSYAQELAERNVEFDNVVFALMQHPSLNLLHISNGGILNSGNELQITQDHSILHKGFIMQQRLCEQMKRNYGSDSITVHAMFVYYALTLRHNLKWQVVRLALERHITLTQRTWQLLISVFVLEKGIRCGAQTVRSIIFALVEKIVQERASTQFAGSTTSTLPSDTFFHTISQLQITYIAQAMYILLRCRRNQHIPALRHLPSSVQFDGDEVLYIVSSIQGRQTQHLHLLPQTEQIQYNYRNVNNDTVVDDTALPLHSKKSLTASTPTSKRQQSHSLLTLVVPVLQQLLQSNGDHVCVMKGIGQLVKMINQKYTRKQIQNKDGAQRLLLLKQQQQQQQQQQYQKSLHKCTQSQDRCYQRHQRQMQKYSNKINMHNNRFNQLSRSERVFATIVNTLVQMQQNEGIPTPKQENTQTSPATDNTHEIHSSRIDKQADKKRFVVPQSFSLHNRHEKSDNFNSNLQRIVANEQFNALCNYSQLRQQEDEAQTKYLRYLPHAWVAPQSTDQELQDDTQRKDNMNSNQFRTFRGDEYTFATNYNTQSVVDDDHDSQGDDNRSNNSVDNNNNNQNGSM